MSVQNVSNPNIFIDNIIKGEETKILNASRMSKDDESSENEILAKGNNSC